MTERRWNAVLFDLDGTLANTVAVIIASYQHTFRTIGVEVTPEEARTWIGLTLEDLFAIKTPGRVEEMCRIYRAFNEAHLEEMVTPFPGIPELCQELEAAGIKTAIATSRGRRSAEVVVKVANVPAATELLVTQDDTSAHKPKPDPLLKGLKLMGTTAAETVYVGDAIYDLQAAAAAGMDGIGVTWGAGEPEALLDEPHFAVVESADALREFLLG